MSSSMARGKNTPVQTQQQSRQLQQTIQQGRRITIQNLAILFPFLIAIMFGTYYRPEETLLYTNTGNIGQTLATTGKPFENIGVSQPPYSSTPYLANKRNVFNQYFAKIAWGWTTLLYLLSLVFIISRSSSSRRLPALLYTLNRYGMATLYWVLMTQWFLGPSVFDRAYVMTGGYCENQPKDVALARSNKECKQYGGQWVGGIDISGHCFLLIHSGLFLWEEAVRPFLREYRQLGRSYKENEGSQDDNGDFSEEKRKIGMLYGALMTSIFIIIGLWLLMLVSTSMYFHDITELLSGTVFGSAYWILAYFIVFPRFSFFGSNID